jgi:hypothetical protein
MKTVSKKQFKKLARECLKIDVSAIQLADRMIKLFGFIDEDILENYDEVMRGYTRNLL